MWPASVSIVPHASSLRGRAPPDASFPRLKYAPWRIFARFAAFSVPRTRRQLDDLAVGGDRLVVATELLQRQRDVRQRLGIGRAAAWPPPRTPPAPRRIAPRGRRAFRPRARHRAPPPGRRTRTWTRPTNSSRRRAPPHLAATRAAAATTASNSKTPPSEARGSPTAQPQPGRRAARLDGAGVVAAPAALLDRDVGAVVIEAAARVVEAVARHELLNLQRAVRAGHVGRQRDRERLRPAERRPCATSIPSASTGNTGGLWIDRRAARIGPHDRHRRIRRQPALARRRQHDAVVAGMRDRLVDRDRDGVAGRERRDRAGFGDARSDRGSA